MRALAAYGIAAALIGVNVLNFPYWSNFVAAQWFIPDLRKEWLLAFRKTVAIPPKREQYVRFVVRINNEDPQTIKQMRGETHISSVAYDIAGLSQNKFLPLISDFRSC